MQDWIKKLGVKGCATGCAAVGILGLALMCCMSSVVFMSLLERL